MFFFVACRDSSWNYDDVPDIEMSRAYAYYFRLGDNEFVLSLQNGQVYIILTVHISVTKNILRKYNAKYCNNRLKHFKTYRKSISIFYRA